jgi:GNAT superfamily N-acetyltransferase
MLLDKIEFTKNPSVNDIDYITEKINLETSSYGKASPFAFFIRDDDSKIIAGANGFLIYGAVYTDQLWVAESHRRKGWASKIMKKIHELGKKERCRIATVETMTFQGAQEFYENLGYIQDFKQDGYVAGSECIFMKKLL